MKKISVVTAKIVRENEQYAYNLVGNGGKYIIMHEDGDESAIQSIIRTNIIEVIGNGSDY